VDETLLETVRTLIGWPESVDELRQKLEGTNQLEDSP
jgi:hypothetical protein